MLLQAPAGWEVIVPKLLDYGITLTVLIGAVWYMIKREKALHDIIKDKDGIIQSMNESHLSKINDLHSKHQERIESLLKEFHTLFSEVGKSLQDTNQKSIDPEKIKQLYELAGEIKSEIIILKTLFGHDGNQRR